MVTLTPFLSEIRKTQRFWKEETGISPNPMSFPLSSENIPVQMEKADWQAEKKAKIFALFGVP